MPCSGGDAETPEFFLDFGHEVEDASADGTKVMIFELLVFGWWGAEECAARLQEIGPLHIEMFVDQEVFLFGTE